MYAAFVELRMRSADWSADLGLHPPDAEDPPELQFCTRAPLPLVSCAVSGSGCGCSSEPWSDRPWRACADRIRPFYIGNTSRIAAHVLQYAPSPSQAQLGVKYGRQPPMCHDPPPAGKGEQCHG